MGRIALVLALLSFALSGAALAVALTRSNHVDVNFTPGCTNGSVYGCSNPFGP